MLLSPEIPIAQLPERSVVIRIDDILLVFLFFTWLAKMAINKQLGFFKKTPINKPLAIYVLSYIVITASAIFLGFSQAKFSTAVFYMLKYIEYLMLFFLVSNNLKSLRQYKVLILFLLLTCFIVSVYGYSQIQGAVGRISAPFEGEKGEPNTLAGYLIIIFGLVIGLFLHSRSLHLKFFLGSFFLFIFPVFLFTLSRAGYIGFIIMYLTILLFSKKNKISLIYFLLVMAIVMPFVLPPKVASRIETTFTGRVKYEVLGGKLTLDEASAARIETWKYVGEEFAKSPLLGHGVAGIDFVDTQYGRILGEFGIFGVLIFFWLMRVLFKNAFKIYIDSKDDFIQGLSLGFLGVLAALLVMSIGSNVFIIVRIMEPFWFFAAMVLMAPQISTEELEQADVKLSDEH